MRKVVTSKDGTASLADKDGYYVGGKQETESYGASKHRINSLSQFFLQKTKILPTCNVRKSEN